MQRKENKFITPPEQAELLEDIFSAAPEAIIVLNHQGHISYSNHSAQVLFGQETTQPGFQNFTDIFPREMQSRMRTSINVALQGESRENVDIVFSPASSITMHLVFSSTPLKEGVLLVARDQTERWKELEQLRSDNLALTDQLGRLGSENEQLQKTTQELEVLTIFDELTRLYTRRYFFHRAEIEYQRAKRYNNSMGVLLIDLDHFKKVNDTFGHLFGDAVLQDGAMLLLGAIRSTDILARYGGEELILLATETGLEGLKVLAERLRTTFEEHVFVHEEVECRVTISLGGCALPPDRFESLEAMIAEADAALYEAKAKRNTALCRDG
jgi:diguanylate cyclase (GGDEF)-like protein/PAS domain S-box-containing protein